MKAEEFYKQRSNSIRELFALSPKQIEYIALIMEEYAALCANRLLWTGWISTEKELPCNDMDGEQILMCLKFHKSESLVLCGVWKDGQFHCLDTDNVYENVSHWAFLPTCPSNV